MAVQAFIQVNGHRDKRPQQGGIAAEAFEGFLAFVREQCPRIIVIGVMALGRDNFGLVRTLSERHALPCRSIGMSEDYREAIQDFGATHIRLGSAIFGPRPPPADK
jgi:uncharacterized pyridoxal phosphate-containing UPF0001 family protein